MKGIVDGEIGNCTHCGRTVYWMSDDVKRCISCQKSVERCDCEKFDWGGAQLFFSTFFRGR